MTGLRTILLATDFTQAAEVAQEVAFHLSWIFNSKISLLHVVEPVKGDEKLQSLLYQQMAAVVRDCGEDLAKKKVEVLEATTVIGRPVAEILNKAQELEPDLVVIGAGRQGKFSPFQMGPIAEAILQQAAAPVLACRPGLPAPIFHKIVCPIDHSQASRHALVNAIRLAKAFKGELVVVTVFAETEWSTQPAYMDQFASSLLALEEGWKGEFEDFLAHMDFEDVTWKKEFLKGKPSAEIVAACRRHEADVLVMGSTGVGTLGNLFLGSVTARVLRALPCSILIVKHRDVLEETLEEETRIIRMLFAEAKELSAASDYPSALVKARQVLARDPFHSKALEVAALASEKLGDEHHAHRFRVRLERTHRAIEGVAEGS